MITWHYSRFYAATSLNVPTRHALYNEFYLLPICIALIARWEMTVVCQRVENLPGKANDWQTDSNSGLNFISVGSHMYDPKVFIHRAKRLLVYMRAK